MIKQMRQKLNLTKSKKNHTKEFSITGLLPLFIITVCVVFSFVFTVLTVPLGAVGTDIKVVFITMLVVSTTVASAVSLIFYMFFLNK